MADLKLVRITKGDTQTVLINKLNQNFGRILSSGGGTYGRTGQAGTIGNPGLTGPTGDYGSPGIRGSKWFVSNLEPPTGLTGYYDGDHWVVSTDDFKDYILTGGVWTPSGLFLTGTQFFTKIEDIKDRTGDQTKNAIVEFTSTPSSTTMVLSDTTTSTSYGNSQYSKFQISTIGSAGRNVLEFSKSELQDGTGAEASKHPYFAWEFDATPNDYSLVWGMTGGGFFLSASDLAMISQTSDFEIGVTGAIIFDNSSSLFQFSKENIEVSTGSDFYLSSTSTSLGATGLSLSGSLKINSDSATVPGVTSDSYITDGGNVRITYTTPSSLNLQDSQISLVNVVHDSITNPLFLSTADGETRFANLSESYNQDLTVLSGATGAYTRGGTGYYINWASVSPAPVGPTADRSLAYFNTVIVSPSGLTGGGTAGNPFNGVSFLGTYGSGMNNNPLAKMIEENRSFSLTVTGTTQDHSFKAVGIGTYSNPASPFPNPSVGSEWQILPFASPTVTFHVMRLPNNGATGSWRVFFEANKFSGLLYEA